MEANGDLWIFGYGSLMWRPGFEYEERQVGVIRGYHRALCIYSHHHRGTRDKPGLVLGLDRGGACKGIAFRVGTAHAAEVLAYLREREQTNQVYKEVRIGAALADGRRVPVLAFVADRSHSQYAGALDLPDLERLVGQGMGISGANPDYVINTYMHMCGIGIADAKLAALSRRFGMKDAPF